MTRTQQAPRAVAARGRPRSLAADRAILEASLDLMAEHGYASLTMERIALRAGVGKATLYRRWKRCEDVIAAAVAHFVSEIQIPDSGALEKDLRLLMEQAVRVYLGRPGKIMPGLVAAMAASDAVAEAVRTKFLAGRRAALSTVLERGVARGELSADVDVELALDFLGGALFYRLLVTGGPLDDMLVQGVVSTMLHGLPSPGSHNAKEDS